MENVYPDLSPPGGGNQQENNNNLAQVKYEKWDQKSRDYLRQFSLGFQETKLCLQSEKMAAAEKKKSKLSFTVWACPQVATAVVEPYNTVS